MFEIRMGDDNVIARLGSVKALLGIVAGAGASYGIYKLVFGRVDGKADRLKSGKSVAVQPGSLMAKVAGFKVVSKNDHLDPSADTDSSKCQKINKAFLRAYDKVL